MSIKHLVAAAAIAITATASHAVETATWNIVSSSSATFSGNTSATFDFTLSGAAPATSSFTIGGPLASVFIDNISFTQVLSNVYSYTGALAAGAHQIRVFVQTGGPEPFIVGSDTYTGQINFRANVLNANIQATTVPEPETYAMMLAGLGAVGFMSRRRRSVQ